LTFLPGIESPSVREKDTSLPCQIYKHIRPLFFNKKANKRSLLDSLEEWARGNLARADVSTHARNNVRQTEADRRANQRHQSEEPPLRLKLTGPEKVRCMEQLLSLILDEEYLLANGRVVDTKKRLAAVSFGHAKGLSPKKRRYDDDAEDEDFHTAPNSPVKSVVLPQSPFAKNDTAASFPQMPQGAFQGPRRVSGTVNSTVNNQRAAQLPARGSGNLSSRSTSQIYPSPGRMMGLFRRLESSRRTSIRGRSIRRLFRRQPKNNLHSLKGLIIRCRQGRRLLSHRPNLRPMCPL
jgi:hypothetical protein